MISILFSANNGVEWIYHLQLITMHFVDYGLRGIFTRVKIRCNILHFSFLLFRQNDIFERQIKNDITFNQFYLVKQGRFFLLAEHEVWELILDGLPPFNFVSLAFKLRRRLPLLTSAGHGGRSACYGNRHLPVSCHSCILL